MPVVKYILKGDAKGAISAFSDTGKAATIAAGALAALTAVAVKGASAVLGLQREIFDLRNELGDLSGQTALSTETLAALRVAAGSTNETLSSFAGGLRRFSKQMNDASTGTGEALDAFEALGIEVANVDGTLRDADAVFQETIRALQQTENETLRAALAADIFGRSGVKLTQALGDIPLEAFNERARVFGTDVGPEAIKAAQEWQSAMEDLGLVTQSVKGLIADAFGLSTQVNVAALTDGFALLRITADEVKTTFLNARVGLVSVSDALRFIADDARFVQEAWSSLLTSILPDLSEWDNIIGRIARRFEDLRDPQRVAADGTREYAASIEESEAARLDFLTFLADMEDSLDADEMALRRTAVATQELVGALSLLDLGELSQEMFDAEAATAAADIMRSNAEEAEAYAQALREVGHEADALARTFDEAIQHQLAVRDGFKDLTDASINAVGAWGSALQNFVKEGSAAFTAFFAIQQAAAAAGIIVNTAEAVTLALKTVPPPAGPALAVAYAATGAAQLANVVAASIGGGGSISAPSGAGGSSAAVGQADTLQEQATAGAGGQPSDGTGSVYIQFRHELYDATVPTASRIPGSAMSRVRKNGARVGQRAVAGTPRKLLA